MRTKYFAIVLAAATAAVCVPSGSAFAAVGEFTYTLEDGSIDTLFDPPEAECVEFTFGVVEAVNNTDRVADLSEGCEPESEFDAEFDAESDAESDADSTEGPDSIAKLEPGEDYRHAAGDPIPLAVTFVTVRSKNVSTREDPGGGSSPSVLDPMIAPR